MHVTPLCCLGKGPKRSRDAVGSVHWQDMHVNREGARPQPHLPSRGQSHVLHARRARRARRYLPKKPYYRPPGPPRAAPLTRPSQAQLDAMVEQVRRAACLLHCIDMPTRETRQRLGRQPVISPCMGALCRDGPAKSCCQVPGRSVLKPSLPVPFLYHPTHAPQSRETNLQLQQLATATAQLASQLQAVVAQRVAPADGSTTTTTTGTSHVPGGAEGAAEAWSPAFLWGGVATVAAAAVLGVVVGRSLTGAGH